ncbi:cytochrome c peroxidase [Aeromonas hydrophila]
MKTSLLLVSLLILTACNDNHSQAPVPSVPVVTPPVVEPPVEPPVVTPPTEPPIEPVPTHTRSELTVRLDVTTRLGQGATLLLRQAATGIAVSGEVGEERPLIITLPAGLLLDQPLELVGSDDSYILRAATARVADLGATVLSARRADAPSLRLDEEETALFLLADRNGDGTLDQGEWGQLAQIRLQQQPLIQDYATLLLAQRQPGAELNYPDSWQMLLALRADQGERSWYRRSNSASIEAARGLLYPAQPSQPDEPETADLLRLDEQGRLTSGTDWRCLHDVRSPAGVKGSQYWLHASGSSALPLASRAGLGVVPTGCGRSDWRLPGLAEFERLLAADKQSWRYPHTFALAVPTRIWLQDGAGRPALYQPATGSWLEEGEGSVLWYALAPYPVRPSVIRDDSMPDMAALRARYAGPAAQWPAARVDEGVEWQELGPLPAVPFPADNPYSRAKVVLGQQLFFDKRLSQAQDISCASCHDPQKGWSDGLSVSVGHQGQKGARNAPSILNSAFSSSQFWDGRVGSLEEQSLHPIQNPVEMALDHDELLARLQASHDYPAAFATAFGDEGISLERIAQAIATFERTIISRDSDFERFVQGDGQALSDKALWGMHLYRTDGRCMNCHSGPLLSQYRFESVGLAYYGRNLEDRGRFLHTRQKADMGRFKTPSLRDVAFTAPYMHNGVFPILAQRIGSSVQGVVAMYNFGVTKWSSGVGFPTGVAQYDPFFPQASDHLHALGLSNDELDAIGEFLRSVSAEPRRTPATVAELGLSGVVDEAPVPAIVIDLQVTPAAPRLEVGQTLALQATLRLSDGTRNPAQGPLQWRSMTPEQVSVDGDGVLHALAVGPARVQVSTGERMLELAVQVVDAQPDFSQGCRHPELAAGELIFVCPLTRAEADRLAVAYDGSARDEDGDYNPFPHDYVVMSQERARDYCQQLVARGHDDWRLPAARELTALFAAYHQGGEELKLLTEQGWPLYSRFWSSDAPNDDGESPLLDPGSGELITDLPQEAHGVACVRAR